MTATSLPTCVSMALQRVSTRQRRLASVILPPRVFAAFNTTHTHLDRGFLTTACSSPHLRYRVSRRCTEQSDSPSLGVTPRTINPVDMVVPETIVGETSTMRPLSITAAVRLCPALPSAPAPLAALAV